MNWVGVQDLLMVVNGVFLVGIHGVVRYFRVNVYDLCERIYEGCYERDEMNLIISCIISLFVEL